MKVHIEFTEDQIMDLLCNYMIDKFQLDNFDKKDIQIQVKSKQNYKSEWGKAAFRAIIDKELK